MPLTAQNPLCFLLVLGQSAYMSGAFVFTVKIIMKVNDNFVFVANGFKHKMVGLYQGLRSIQKFSKREFASGNQ